jgi:hypothetical protein
MKEHALTEDTFSVWFMAGLRNELVGSVVRSGKLVAEAWDSSGTQRKGKSAVGSPN